MVLPSLLFKTRVLDIFKGFCSKQMVWPKLICASQWGLTSNKGGLVRRIWKFDGFPVFKRGLGQAAGSYLCQQGVVKSSFASVPIVIPYTLFGDSGSAMVSRCVGLVWASAFPNEFRFDASRFGRGRFRGFAVGLPCGRFRGFAGLFEFGSGLLDFVGRVWSQFRGLVRRPCTPRSPDKTETFVGERLCI